MLSHTTGLIAQAEQFVTALLNLELDEARYFHGLDHTRDVVENCKRLAFLESCNEKDTETLLTAAWFHDTGYVKGSKGHELEGCRIARRFFAPFQLQEGFVMRVEELIMATRMPTSPHGALEEILCDADMGHLGSAAYWRWQLRLKQELEFAEGFRMTDEEWRIKNIKFFERHCYYTVHGRAMWDDQKKTNLRILQSLANKSV